MKIRSLVHTSLAVLLVSGAAMASGNRRAMTSAELQSYTQKALAVRAQGAAVQPQVFAGHYDERGIPYVRGFHKMNGVRIWGSDFVMKDEGAGMRVAGGEDLGMPSLVETTPTLSAGQAMAMVRMAPGARTFLALDPTAELVVYPVRSSRPKAEFMSVAPQDLKADQMEEALDYLRLAYHVTGYTRECLIDAHTGEIFANWSQIKNADTATLNTLWSGVKKAGNTQSSSKYVLTDPTRGFSVRDMGFTGSMGSIFTDYNNDNTWGDGKQFNGNKTNKNTDNYQTAAADVYYHVQVTYEMYKNVLNFPGINGSNKMPTVGVHLGDSNGNPYDNAFYQNNTIQFGDGYQAIFSLTSQDIVSHEFSHGVCENTSGYVYSGESGGMNESNSDIMGEMAEFYGQGANSQGSVIPNTGADWLVGGKIMRPNGTPMRWFVKPSKDGKSPDYWTTNAPNVEVHAGSGVGNRAFYFLSVGGQGTDSSKDDYSKTMNVNKAGWVGIGNDKAARIHFKALVDYATSSDKYKTLRANQLKAAADLYGADSREYKVVNAAWAAVAVGTDDVKVPDLNQDQLPVVSNLKVASTGPDNTGALTFSTDATDDKGVSQVDFYVDGGSAQTDTTAPYALTLSNGLADGNHTVKAVATDTAGQKSEPVTVTFTVGSQSDTAAPTVSNVNAAVSGTSVTLSADATDNVGVKQVVFSVDGSVVNTDTTSPYSYVLSGVAAGSHTLSVTASDAAGNTSQPVTKSFTVSDQTGSELIKNGGFEEGTLNWKGDTGVIGTWVGKQVPYEGQRMAYLGGNGYTSTERIYQPVTIPANATSATLTFMLHIDTAETDNTVMDTLKVSVANTSNTILRTLATYSNMNSASGYQKRTFDISEFRGKTVWINFRMNEDPYLQTSFVVDNVSLQVK